MPLRYIFLSAPLMFASGVTTSSAAIAQSSSEIRVAPQQEIFEGDWENAFLASRLVFRFKVENGHLVGWFVSTKNGQSYPLKDIRAKGRALSFIYAATPEITYTLTAQKGDQELSGVWSTPNGAAMPTALVRKHSQ